MTWFGYVRRRDEKYICERILKMVLTGKRGKKKDQFEGICMELRKIIELRENLSNRTDRIQKIGCGNL